MDMKEVHIDSTNQPPAQQPPPPYQQLGLPPTTNVIITSAPPAPPVAVQQSQIKPKTNLVLAFVTVFMNPLFGTIAVVFSVLSEKAYGKGNVEKARKHGSTSMLISVFGIAIAIIVAGVLFAIYVLKWRLSNDCDDHFNIYTCKQAGCTWHQGFFSGYCHW